MVSCLLLVLPLGNQKALSPAAGKGPDMRVAQTRPDGRPEVLSPLVQASAPRTVRGIASATLGKPLIRECLFYPDGVFRCRQGNGLCVTREPRLPRMSQRPPGSGNLSDWGLGLPPGAVNFHFGTTRIPPFHDSIPFSVVRRNAKWVAAILRQPIGLVLVPGGGLEPPRPCDRWILSPLRLPIPPSRQELKQIAQPACFRQDISPLCRPPGTDRPPLPLPGEESP